MDWCWQSEINVFHQTNKGLSVGIKSGLVWQFARVVLDMSECQAICRARSLQLHKTHISPINLSPARADPELAWCVTAHCPALLCVGVSPICHSGSHSDTRTVFIRLRAQRRGACSWCEYKHSDKQWGVLTHCHFNFLCAMWFSAQSGAQRVAIFVCQSVCHFEC